MRKGNKRDKNKDNSNFPLKEDEEKKESNRQKQGQQNNIPPNSNTPIKRKIIIEHQCAQTHLAEGGVLLCGVCGHHLHAVHLVIQEEGRHKAEPLEHLVGIGTGRHPG